MNPEQARLNLPSDELAAWRNWGPYLSERQWGTVREDYSADGDAWDYFPFEMAHQRAYRWGEDGIGGFSDAKQRLCVSVALWNEQDSILKERLFGLSGPEGNHAEDVKELYYYQDGLPTHAYMRMLYKYPQGAFPYEELRERNRRRGRSQPEYEIWDTGLFEEGYFDVDLTYAKENPQDLVLRVEVTNHGPQGGRLHVLPQIWFRNTWSWAGRKKPVIELLRPDSLILKDADETTWYAQCSWNTTLFTENETNPVCFGLPASPGYFKDAFHRWVISGKPDAVNPEERGTKAAFHGILELAPGESKSVWLRLSSAHLPSGLKDAAEVVRQKQRECDAFYEELQQGISSEDLRDVQRQAYAGMLWTKQVYNLNVETWLLGDPKQPAPPPERKYGRNRRWKHLSNCDVISMPDKWEYPWYAAWDLAFHCVPLAEIDPGFAKDQLLLFTREWYQHPNGQIPAYEWNFGDVNPPVHAWGALEVYEIDRRKTGKPDKDFLARIFQKLLLNFTWWVNRKDSDDNNVFEGGFLGLDNISLFDRSKGIPGQGRLEQADGTGWMAMYCLNMLRMALELAEPDNAYEDMASKFFEHFLFIAGAMNNMGDQGLSIWDDEEDFYHDLLLIPDQPPRRLQLRSVVGLIPVFAVELVGDTCLRRLPGFERRMQRLREVQPELAGLVSRWEEQGTGGCHLLSIARAYRMSRVLRRVLDPEEFLADHGVRSLSRFYRDHPYRLRVGEVDLQVRYAPGESDVPMFGGNSNWRGPIWFPINYLLISSLRKYHEFYGEDFQLEFPTGSGNFCSLDQIADDLAARLTNLFKLEPEGNRAIWGNHELFKRPDFRDRLLFHEYFNGDTGKGHGASHQTGWTGLIASLIHQLPKE